ncbi:hypothetical protein [Lampropedia aestuarii]|uniref:hypothetical protein n=1 Tax=Lampropedia aestuarii TaxID=2562762 RepID=UPI002468787F|nr:hypothetical protein [Lampropedia aestuarii]MDH5856534.1 hypothetical protein [Lampropedia aestuarii]
MNKLSNYAITLAATIYSIFVFASFLGDGNRITSRMDGSDYEKIIHFILLSIFASGITHTIIMINNSIKNKNFILTIIVAIVYAISIPINFIIAPFVFLLVIINILLIIASLKASDSI